MGDEGGIRWVRESLPGGGCSWWYWSTSYRGLESELDCGYWYQFNKGNERVGKRCLLLDASAKYEALMETYVTLA